MATSSVDVYIVGTGMVGYRQLTREHEQAFEAAERVYVLNPLPEAKEYIHDRCESVIDLTDEYEPGGERAQSYERMAERVVDGAETVDGPVVLAVYGHPVVGVTPTGLIRDEAAQRDLTVEIYPGISSLDCLYVDLDVNPLDSGVQVYEATDVLVREVQLDPATPAFLMQIGLVGTRLYDRSQSAPERFRDIRAHLEGQYPSDHEVSLVRTATLPLADAEQRWFPLAEFESMAEQVDATHTLYIPPAEGRATRNERIAEQAYSDAHLDRITEE
ncbi:SAM-dependent methyltransferase [Natrialbaceae archaeon A-arb3/5]